MNDFKKPYYKVDQSSTKDQMPMITFVSFLLNILANIFVGAYLIVQLNHPIVGTLFICLAALTVCSVIQCTEENNNNDNNNKKTTYKFSDYE